MPYYGNVPGRVTRSNYFQKEKATVQKENTGTSNITD